MACLAVLLSLQSWWCSTVGDWILDLCSGLGGASEAFSNDPYWEVVRIENNVILSGVPHTRLLSVLEWIDWLPALINEMGSRPTVIWASPPCLEFSQGYNAPMPKARREGIHFEPDMSILEACIDIVEFARPRFHIIENVSGASNWFFPELGSWKQHIGPFFLWGSFPILHCENFVPGSGKTQEWGIGDPLRANKRAIVPIEISRAFLDAICSQSKLSDFI
jgi:site-specific DNA-cytosine methylase